LAIVGGRPEPENPRSALEEMANIASQKKRILRSAREHDENRRLSSAVKTHFHRLEEAVAANDAGTIEAEHRSLVSRIDKAVQNGALHPRNGARKKSRAARLVARS
jgi:small subunit ribosomal protein S20